MYQPSYWEKVTFFKNIDVCIIGSGITGLCSSILMKQKQRDMNILVIDKNFLPYGASTRNAGFACFGSPTELISDLRNEDEEVVFNRILQRWRGLQLLRQLVGDSKMDYEPLGGFEIFGKHNRPNFEEVESKLNYLNSSMAQLIGHNQTYTDASTRIKDFKFFGVNHIIKNNYEGQLHTGKLMKNLLEIAQNIGVNLITSLGVSKIENDGNKVNIKCENGFEFKASKCLVATNGFAKQLLPHIDVTPARAQVLITKPVQNLSFKGAFHYNEGFYYFRNIDDRILLGGGRNLNFTAENTTRFGVTKLIQDQLEKMLREIIAPSHKIEIDMRWSGLMGLGSSKSTIIQKVEKNIFCAVRLGGMGVAIGSMIGKQAAEMILES